MIKDRSVSSGILDVVVYGFCLFVLVATVFPFLNILSTSLSGNKFVSTGDITFYPKDVTFEAYERIMSNWLIPNAFKNSVVYTLVSTVYSALITVTMAYPLTKKNFILKKPIWIMLVITMYFSGGMIPLFILITKTRIFNTIWGQVLPCAISIGNLILMRMFINTIPIELEESAFLDGANEAQILFKIILPLSKAGIATTTLYYAVWKWNDFFNPLLYFKDYDKYPLTVILRDIVIQGSQLKKFNTAVKGTPAMRQMAEKSAYAAAYDARLKYGTLMVSMLPIIAVYPILQKYFIKGLMVGSVKG